MKEKLPKATKVCLEKGNGEPSVTLEIAPTMQNITYHGERYFRTRSFRMDEHGERETMYLWSGYADYILEQKGISP